MTFSSPAFSISSPTITLSHAPTPSPSRSPSLSSSAPSVHLNTPALSPSPSVSSQFDDFSPSQQKDLDYLAKITDKRRSMRIRHRPSRKAQKKKETDKIPRPLNCFMAYRLEKQKLIADLLPGANHRDISKMVAKWWREEPEQVKQKYRAAADKAKEKHSQLYPDYKYSPKRKRPYNYKRINGTIIMASSSSTSSTIPSDKRCSDNRNPFVFDRQSVQQQYPCSQLSTYHQYSGPEPQQQYQYPSPYQQQQQQQTQPQYYYYPQQERLQQPTSYQWSMLQPPSVYSDPNLLWNTVNNNNYYDQNRAATPTDDPMFGSGSCMSSYCSDSNSPYTDKAVTSTCALKSVLNHNQIDIKEEEMDNTMINEEGMEIGPNWMYYSDFLLLAHDDNNY